MRRLLDTSAIYAWVDPADANHVAARAQLREPGLRLWTTNIVMGEAFTLLRRRLGFRVAFETVNNLFNSPRVRVVPVTASGDAQTLHLLQQMAGVPLSYADASLLILGKDERITTIFSFDSDFRMAGLETVPTMR